jgi:hypothetical protein
LLVNPGEKEKEAATTSSVQLSLPPKTKVSTVFI